jgi:hypothetical protein
MMGMAALTLQAMTKRSRQQSDPPATGGGGAVPPAWAWSAKDGATGSGGAARRPSPRPPAPPARDEKLEALRRELATERAATASAIEAERRAREEAAEARRLLDQERGEAAARCLALEQRAEAALIQARADADALNAVALAARATESRASALAEELAALKAGRRRRWGRPSR